MWSVIARDEGEGRQNADASAALVPLHLEQQQTNNYDSLPVLCQSVELSKYRIRIRNPWRVLSLFPLV
jgi:hypothetical protein